MFMNERARGRITEITVHEGHLQMLLILHMWEWRKVVVSQVESVKWILPQSFQKGMKTYPTLILPSETHLETLSFKTSGHGGSHL